MLHNNQYMYLKPGESKELGGNTISFSWIFGSPTLKKKHMGQTMILCKTTDKKILHSSIYKLQQQNFMYNHVFFFTASCHKKTSDITF